MVLLIMIVLGFALKNGSFQTKEGTVDPITRLTADKSVVPGSCIVLEEKYCRTVKLVTINGALIAAFELPAGVPIFSPYAGAKSFLMYPGRHQYKISIYKGIKLNDDWYKTKSILDITFTGDTNMANQEVSKGDILAITGETNVTDSSVTGAHNLLMYFTKNESDTPDNAKTKAVFGVAQPE